MTTGFTSGCWNLLHPGHVWFLNQCKKLCDTLIVGVARDNITKHKRVPVINEDQRLYMIKNLNCVDKAILEDEQMPPENIRFLLESIKPDFYITNLDNTYLEKAKNICKELKIPVILMERNNDGIFNISTTQIINSIKEEK